MSIILCGSIPQEEWRSFWKIEKLQINTKINRAAACLLQDFATALSFCRKIVFYNTLEKKSFALGFCGLRMTSSGVPAITILP